MKIEDAIDLARHAESNPSLIPNHTPTVPNCLQREVDSLRTCISAYCGDESEAISVTKWQNELENISKLLKIYKTK